MNGGSAANPTPPVLCSGPSLLQSQSSNPTHRAHSTQPQQQVAPVKALSMRASCPSSCNLFSQSQQQQHRMGLACCSWRARLLMPHVLAAQQHGSSVVKAAAQPSGSSSSSFSSSTYASETATRTVLGCSSALMFAGVCPTGLRAFCTAAFRWAVEAMKQPQRSNSPSSTRQNVPAHTQPRQTRPQVW